MLYECDFGRNTAVAWRHNSSNFFKISQDNFLGNRSEGMFIPIKPFIHPKIRRIAITLNLLKVSKLKSETALLTMF